MSSKLSTLPALELEGIEIRPGDGGVRFAGVISMRDPSTSVTPYLKRVHAATVDAGLKTLKIDLVELRFMNSSSIRSLVDWIEWIRKEPESRRYVLHFVTKPDATWQETTLTAIQSLGGEHVVVQKGR